MLHACEGWLACQPSYILCTPCIHSCTHQHASSYMLANLALRMRAMLGGAPCCYHHQVTQLAGIIAETQHSPGWTSASRCVFSATHLPHHGESIDRLGSQLPGCVDAGHGQGNALADIGTWQSSGRCCGWLEVPSSTSDQSAVSRCIRGLPQASRSRSNSRAWPYSQAPDQLSDARAVRPQ